MIDEKRFKRKYLLALLISPITLFPFVGGFTLACILGLVDKVALALVSLLTGAAVSFGFFVQRLVLGSEKLARKVQEEIEQENKETRESSLDELERQLIKDRDPRTEEALRDLRLLADTFKKDEAWKKRINAQSVYDLLSVVDRIFKQCVNSLKTTLELYKTANQAASKKVKESILKRRDEIVRNVQQNVEELAKTLGEMQELTASNNQAAKLSKLGQELKQQLEIAQQVDERMRNEFGEFSSDVDEFE